MTHRNPSTLVLLLTAAVLLLLAAWAPGCGPGGTEPGAGGAATPAEEAPAAEEAAPPVEVLIGVDPAAPPEALERARAAAGELLATLKGKLVAAMQKEGPAGALAVCHDVAQKVAASFQQDDLAIHRVSLKARNPADRPDPWEAELLRQLEQAKAAGALPGEVAQVLEDANGHRVLRYAKPLVVGKACLACHGDPAQMKPEVRERLAELYPDDRATGYREGDLRGIVSVTVRLD